MTAERRTIGIEQSETDYAQDLELVRSVARPLRVKPRRADEIIDEIVGAVRTWRTEAKRARITKAEQDRMANAFSVLDTT
jgi:hypothetical protein